MVFWKSLLRSLFVSGSEAENDGGGMGSGHLRVADIPRRLYLVGDVHGRLDLLKLLEAQIADDAGPIGEREVVYLGDLIDRGPESAGVLDYLLARPPKGVTRRVLAGNHELMFLRFLEAPRAHLSWLEFGGVETLSSYGVSRTGLNVLRSSNARGRDLLDSHVPEEHIAFLQSLPLLIEYPHCIAVHAGIRPGVPLEKQTPQDLTSIRDEFLAANADLGRPVVHGHTPVAEAEHHTTRINVDTAAYATGRLTAVCLTADRRARFISTCQDLIMH